MSPTTRRSIDNLVSAAKAAQASILMPEPAKAAISAAACVVLEMAHELHTLREQLQELREHRRPPCEGCGPAVLEPADNPAAGI